MPKMRGIKPETWTDDKVIELSPLARLLFIGMWNYACDNGHVEDKPKQLKLRILPADDCDVSGLLAEMLAAGCVVRRDDHLSIPNLPLHQRIDKRYFTSCEHCRPDEIPEGHVVRTASTRRAHDGDPTGTRVEGRKEGTDGEGEGESRAGNAGLPKAKKARQLPPDFRPTEKHIELANELHVDLRAEWPKFCDHHTAKGSTFKDWNAALRTWIRNANKFAGPGLRAVPPSEDNSWMRRRL